MSCFVQHYKVLIKKTKRGMQHVLVLISIIVIQAALALLHTGAKLNISVKSAFFPPPPK